MTMDSMECSSRTASQSRCGRRKRSSKEGKRTTQLSDRPVESVMPTLHKERNEEKRRPSYRIRTPSKACPALLSGVHSKGSTRRIGCMQETQINVTFARGSQAFLGVWRESISGPWSIALFLSLSSLFLLDLLQCYVVYVLCRERSGHRLSHCWHCCHSRHWEQTHLSVEHQLCPSALISYNPRMLDRKQTRYHVWSPDVMHVTMIT